MFKRDIYSLAALGMVLVAETFAVLALQMERPCFWIIPAALVLMLLALWCYGNTQGMEYRIKGVVISKLLANIIAPRFISAFYLLAFVVHIGWLSDGSLNFFLPKEYMHPGEVATSLASGVIGMVFIIAFFPRAATKKDNNATKLFVSGLSFPSIPQEYKKFNMKPFVRILQNADSVENTKMLILKSKSFEDGAITSSRLLEIFQYVKDSNPDVSFNDIEEKLAKDKEAEEKKEIERVLKLLIVAVAKVEFKNKNWKWITLVDNISFTEACDYDNFNDCYEKIRERLNVLDDKNSVIHFNMTPGTSTIGGLMTLFAMDPQRSLYYYRQNDGLEDDKRMVEITKDYETIKTLFTNTLEKIQNEEI